MNKLHYLLNTLFYILGWYLVIAIITEEYDPTRWRYFNQLVFQIIIIYQMIKIAHLEDKNNN
ncbi:hypothetical protein [Capnocytophaga stomatis]|uniref:hypothetical protein n=1 Tax=Capnocytophaga stomatis TaxID=1848904 RepID=UPI001BB45403|nr:hypothetical protein [Capnocytophaga stomatis]